MKKGLTLTEVLIVVALILMFAGLVLPISFGFYQESTLKDQTRNLENALRMAQAMAISGQSENNAGVKIEPTEGFPEGWRYVIFEGESYEKRLRGTETIIPFTVSLSTEETEVMFQKSKGLPIFQEGEERPKSIILRLGGLSAQITIDSQGKIERHEPIRL